MFAHDNEIRGRYQRNNRKCPLFKTLLNNSTELITQSGFQQTELLTLYKKPSLIIKSGYDIEPYSKAKGDYILWVSRLEPWKQPELFLELAENHPEFQFLMIAPVIKNQREYGEEIIRKAGKISNLNHIPFVHFSEINSYYKKAVIFVNTSTFEGFPNTFIQACKNGIPLLSLNVNPDQFIDEYDCGFFCGNDKSRLNLNLEFLISNRSVYSRKSKNGYNYAKKYHDIKKNVDKLAGLLS